MSAVDVLISNGTCFYAAGEQSSNNIIPCGNVANGPYACCEEGDFCLEDNVCYNQNHSTTYMAGCTDEEFTSPSCPEKGSSQQQILGLVQCAGSESTGSVYWSACPGATTKTELGAPQACTCSDSADALLFATTSFPQVASLPTATGETISFHKGHTPSAKGSATMTSTAENGQKTTMTMPVATAGSSSAASSSGSGGLSAGAKAGIGVGAAALGIGLLALAAFLFTLYRRKHAKGAGGNGGGAAKYEAGTTAPGQVGGGYGPSPPPPQYATADGQYHNNNNQPVSPMGDMAAAGYAGSPGFTGFKSELPCEGEVKPAFKSELPADSPTARALEKGGAGAPSVMSAAGASPAPTGHASMVSDVSSEGYGRGPNRGSMSPIAELHG